jgi:hypothetical protein
MEKITGFLIDVDSQEAKKVTVEKSLDGYYGILNCDCIDIVTRKIGGKRFAIVCDDEALLKSNPTPSAFDKDGYPMLFGNLFVTNNAGEDIASITDEDEAIIFDAVKYGQYLDSNFNLLAIPCLTDVSY